MSWTGTLQGYTRRKSITVLGLTVPDYQMRLTVHKYGLGPDTGVDIYLGGHCRDDFIDIRFTGPNGTTLLGYWIESYNTGDWAIIWIKVPTLIPTNQIYIYYDNPLESVSTSSGDAAFILFDDFSSGIIDPLKWTAGAGASVVSNQLRLTGSVTNVTSVNDIGFDNTLVEMRAFKESTPDQTENIGFYARSDAAITRFIYTQMEYLTWGPAGHNFYAYKNDGSLVEVRHQGNYWSNLTWYTLRMHILPSSFNSYLYGPTGNLIDSITNFAYNSAGTSTKFIIRHNSAYTGSGVSFVDDIRIRKYTSPEPTFGVTGIEELNVTPTELTLNTNTCFGQCTIAAGVTWLNLGNADITLFDSAIEVDKDTPDSFIVDGPNVSITAGGTNSTLITTPVLSIGIHSICPFVRPYGNQ